jgi:hypothetical protein
MPSWHHSGVLEVCHHLSSVRKSGPRCVGVPLRDSGLDLCTAHEASHADTRCNVSQAPGWQFRDFPKECFSEISDRMATQFHDFSWFFMVVWVSAFENASVSHFDIEEFAPFSKVDSLFGSLSLVDAFAGWRLLDRQALYSRRRGLSLLALSYDAGEIEIPIHDFT